MRLRWHNWPFKNTTLLIVSLVIFFALADSSIAQAVIRGTGELGYIGAFFTGLLFVSTFTVAPAAAILFSLAEILNPIGVALLAGLGAMLGDFVIFRFMKDRVFDELEDLFLRLGGSYLIDLFKTPFFGWMLPLVGAVMIASPLPDEMGISLLGLSKLKQWQFLLLTFSLNALGILAVVMLARAL
ncbi:MAG TPA: hypothetical protein VK963_03440 [Candidatus Saccharimonadales bacterium]|nr:hypothetical protein [Candidatus Saccharimonadales bacterium]